MLPILESIVQSGKPLSSSPRTSKGEALAALVVNKLRGGLKICGRQGPGFGIAARPCWRTRDPHRRPA